MPVISLLGSSHANPRHLLPSILTQKYDASPESFKKKYALQTARGISGGQITKEAVVNELVSVAQETAEMPGYRGQVLILLAGTNDWANPATTEEEFQETYKKLVDKLFPMIDQLKKVPVRRAIICPSNCFR